MREARLLSPNTGQTERQGKAKPGGKGKGEVGLETCAKDDATFEERGEGGLHVDDSNG